MSEVGFAVYAHIFYVKPSRKCIIFFVAGLFDYSPQSDGELRDPAHYYGR